MSRQSPSTTPTSLSAKLLKASGVLWFIAAATGQLAFIAFIVLYYYTRTLSGNLSAWNDKPIIQGYTAGDDAGNFMFAVHVLLAAMITLAGILQLIPGLRRRAPALHSWSGRLFMLMAVIMAAGGLWLVIVRGTYITVISAIPTSINGVLILITAGVALYFAVTRQIDRHRRWAMRLWLLVNGVWFFRILIMAWAIIMQGAGLTDTLSSPVDLGIAASSYLLPIGILQLYLMAQDTSHMVPKIAMSVLLLVCTGIIAIGTFGAVAFMWWPYI
ncbi:DUF2306 domain-containing protein [Parvularcula flava]|uniref:DUF2306 domain-containing protein n=2 Tax=Aquisalinus luteolus TaxID=1566827 RepID=A0A8J3EPW5_9PROT|nr:DUF2306 domain-containing protein [Aquisalinus luteolus]GGH92553.1 membrane protein [Aquisalinus luteolus]